MVIYERGESGKMLLMSYRSPQSIPFSQCVRSSLSSLYVGSGQRITYDSTVLKRNAQLIQIYSLKYMNASVLLHCDDFC